jgi:conjugative transfer signal peptidase TraF
MMAKKYPPFTLSAPHQMSRCLRTVRPALRSLGLVLLGGGLVGLVCRTHLLYNPSPSAPLGWYWRTAPPQTLQPGLLVLIAPPEAVHQEVALIDPTVAGYPWIKPIAALPGDRVCLEPDAVTINGIMRGPRPLLSRYPRLPRRLGCTVVPPDGYVALSQYARAFDSRYVGVLERTTILGRVHPVWTWPAEVPHD